MSEHTRCRSRGDRVVERRTRSLASLGSRAQEQLDGEHLHDADADTARCSACWDELTEGDEISVLGVRHPGQTWVIALRWCLGCSKTRVQESARGDVVILDGEVGMLSVQSEQTTVQVFVAESVADIREQRRPPDERH